MYNRYTFILDNENKCIGFGDNKSECLGLDHPNKILKPTILVNDQNIRQIMSNGWYSVIAKNDQMLGNYYRCGDQCKLKYHRKIIKEDVIKLESDLDKDVHQYLFGSHRLILKIMVNYGVMGTTITTN